MPDSCSHRKFAGALCILHIRLVYVSYRVHMASYRVFNVRLAEGCIRKAYCLCLLYRVTSWVL